MTDLPDAETAPAPLGDQTAGMLLSMFQEAYRHELGAEEDIHRTLPFFATALGLIVAAINFTAAQLPSLGSLAFACPSPAIALGRDGALACGWPLLLVASLLALTAMLGIAVLAFLAAASGRLGYQRVGPETAHLERASTLRAWHQSLGLEGEALDSAVALDFQQQLLADFARVTNVNRQLTRQRYRLRARALYLLLGSLLAALLATIFALAIVKTGLYIRTR